MAKYCRSGLVWVATVGLGACALFDDDGLAMRISANQGSVSPFEQVGLTVTAENTGTSRIVWGQGSSSCQLHAVVRVQGRDERIVSPPRLCTADVVEHGLDPGESRSETILWNGYVPEGDSLVLLSGAHEVRGAAGDVALSDPVEIRVLQQ